MITRSVIVPDPDNKRYGTKIYLKQYESGLVVLSEGRTECLKSSKRSLGFTNNEFRALRKLLADWPEGKK